MNTKDKGYIGETLACRYLRRKHYKILERNRREGRAEIDVICENKTHVVFVEVKSRIEDGLTYRPSSAVNAGKERMLGLAVNRYMKKYSALPFKKPHQPRIDVIEVYLKQKKNRLVLGDRGIFHIENAVTDF
ncbi:MAG: YraN family protein [Clostridia bacterium]|nr:YraN family protein [Clostridia bacterium]